MFFTASGSRFLIGAVRPGWDVRPASASDFAAETWIPVEGVSSLGRLGGEWGTETWTVPNPEAPDDPLMTAYEKTTRPNLSMQVIAATMEDDPGQLAMLAAEASVAAYPFRIEFPSGALRSFVGLVISAEQVVDEANSVLCWSFGLVLQSTLVRG